MAGRTRLALQPAAMPASTSVDHVLEVMRGRLQHAELETDNLAKQLAQYGFKKFPAEKPDVEASSNSDSPFCEATAKPKLDAGLSHSLLSRLCQLESVVDSMKEGLSSLQTESGSEKQRLLQESHQMREGAAEQLLQVQAQLTHQVEQTELYSAAKLRLEKQVSKLKKEIERHVSDGQLLKQELDAVEQEREVFKAKIAELSGELLTEKSAGSRMMNELSVFAARFVELESRLKSEQAKFLALQTDFKTATKELDDARKKELDSRLLIEDRLQSQAKELETINEEYCKVTKENLSLSEKVEAVRVELANVTNTCSIVMHQREEYKVSAEGLLKENGKLREALKMAVSESQAVSAKNEDLLNIERSKMQEKLSQQDRMFDAAKEAILKELAKEKSSLRDLEKEHSQLRKTINVLQHQLSDKEFEMNLLKQTHATSADNMSVVNKELKIELQFYKEQLSAQDSKFHAKLTALHDEKLAISKELNQSKIAYEKFERLLEESEGHANRLEVEKRALEEQVASLSKQIEDTADLQNQLALQNKKFNNANLQLQEMKRQNQSAKTDLANMAELRTSLHQLEVRVKALNEKLEQSEKREASLKLKLHECNSSLERKQRMLECGRSDKVAVGEKIEAMERAHKSECAKLRKQVLNLTSSLKAQEKENRAHVEGMQLMQSQLRELEESKKLYTQKNKEQASLLEVFSQQIEGLRSDMTELLTTKSRRRKPT